MPRPLIAAFAASLALHAVALLGVQIDLAQPPERPPLLAELVMPPRLQPVSPAEEKKAEAPQPARPSKTKPPRAAPAKAPVTPVPEAGPQPRPEVAAPEPAAPRAAVKGAMRFRVVRGTQDFEAGRAESEWEFADGNYRIRLMMETTGVAVMFKSIRMEQESRGKLTSGGLRPERFVTRRNGAETNETIEFDWVGREAVLGRSGSRQPLADGVQDLLSFQYQLAYLPEVVDGTTLLVATARKIEPYRFQLIGEEELETAAGVFKTLHVKVPTEHNTTELWLALDRGLLPMKIRHIDRKGETTELIITEMGTPQQ